MPVQLNFVMISDKQLIECRKVLSPQKLTPFHIWKKWKWTWVLWLAQNALEAPCEFDNMKIQPQKQTAAYQQNLLLLFIANDKISKLNDMDAILKILLLSYTLKSTIHGQTWG